MGILLLVIAALSGIAIGILSGMLGVGGGTVMVPLFRLGFGMAAIEATATSLFCIIPSSVAGCITHIRNRTCVPGVGLAAGLGGAFLSPVGVWLATISPSWAIVVVAAAIIVYSAISMLWKGLRAAPRSATQKAAAKASASSKKPVRGPVVHATRRQLMLGFLVGTIAGLAGGYVGVGGGFVMVPLFINLLGISMKQASGTSLIGVAILAIPGTVMQLMLGNVSLLVGVAVVAGSIPGAIIGANLQRHIPERTLRILFGIMLIVAAIALVAREVV